MKDKSLDLNLNNRKSNKSDNIIVNNSEDEVYSNKDLKDFNDNKDLKEEDFKELKELTELKEHKEKRDSRGYYDYSYRNDNKKYFDYNHYNSFNSEYKEGSRRGNDANNLYDCNFEYNTEKDFRLQAKTKPVTGEMSKSPKNKFEYKDFSNIKKITNSYSLSSSKSTNSNLNVNNLSNVKHKYSSESYYNDKYNFRDNCDNFRSTITPNSSIPYHSSFNTNSTAASSTLATAHTTLGSLSSSGFPAKTPYANTISNQCINGGSNISTNTQQILRKMAKSSYMRHKFSNELTENVGLEDEKGSFQEFFDYSFFNAENKNQDYYGEVDYSDINCHINENSRLLNNKIEDDIFEAEDFMSLNNIVNYYN